MNNIFKTVCAITGGAFMTAIYAWSEFVFVAFISTFIFRMMFDLVELMKEANHD